MENEIEQAVMFKDKVQRAIIDATGEIAVKETPSQNLHMLLPHHLLCQHLQHELGHQSYS